MKIIKRKVIWTSVIGLAGIALLLVNMVQSGVTSTTTSFAAAITGVSIARILQLYRISRNPKLLKKYQIGQKEERFISIAEKSGRYTLLLTIVVEFIAIFILILLNHHEIATIVSYVAATQTFVYLILYYYLSRKY